MSDPEPRRRNSLRLPEYDYSQAGAYFVTVVVKGRVPMFGKVIDEEVELSEYGKVVENAWLDLPNHYEHISLDEFIIMPNHVHGIIFLHHTEANGVGAIHTVIYCVPLLRQRRTMLLSKLMGRFKTVSAKQINQKRRTPGTPFWQRGYFDHVIRNEDDLNQIRDYIATNPSRWTLKESA